ncbi:hypothetical protein QZH41_008884 [Actinostola sp. cb2023]|nr:hypothetical protein QZH41_008884 [Actinostola sp. cb2023]
MNEESLNFWLTKFVEEVVKLHVIANQRSEERRAEYRRKIADYHPDQLLFIDESSKDDRTFQRQYAWDLKGHKISRKGNFTRGTRFSVLCAISSKQTEMAHVIVGPFNSRQFEYAVEHFLVPLIGSAAHKEPCSVVVIDNCPLHYSNVALDLIRSAGGIVVFLP